MPPTERRFGNRIACWDDALIPDLSGATDWDVATRYADFGMPLARGTRHQSGVAQLRRVAAAALLRRAREVLGAVVHPTRSHVGPFGDLPPDALRVDVSIGETLDEALPAMLRPAADLEIAPASDIHVTYATRRPQPVVLCLDTSLSMQGEKGALMGVAVAVVLLQFAEDAVGVVGFDDRARVLKRPTEPLAPERVIGRLLDAPGRPYTNIESGLRSARALARERPPGSALPSTVLVTDGKYTSGRDPAPLANAFDHLLVLKVGDDASGVDLCRDLARRGQGSLREVPRLEALPVAMYRAVKEILRGRPH